MMVVMQKLRSGVLCVCGEGVTSPSETKRKARRKEKMCGCKKIRLECRVRESMTKNHRRKLCAVTCLARIQRAVMWGDGGADRGRDRGEWTSTKMQLNPEKQTRIPPWRREEIQRRLGLSERIYGGVLSDSRWKNKTSGRWNIQLE